MAKDKDKNKNRSKDVPVPGSDDGAPDSPPDKSASAEFPRTIDNVQPNGHVALESGKFEKYSWKACHDHRFGTLDIKHGATVNPWAYTVAGWRMVRVVDHNRFASEIDLVIDALDYAEGETAGPNARMCMKETRIRFVGNKAEHVPLDPNVPAGTPWKRNAAALRDRDELFDRALPRIEETPKGSDQDMHSAPPTDARVSFEEMNRRLGNPPGYTGTFNVSSNAALPNGVPHHRMDTPVHDGSITTDQSWNMPSGENTWQSGDHSASAAYQSAELPVPLPTDRSVREVFHELIYMPIQNQSYWESMFRDQVLYERFLQYAQFAPEWLVKKLHPSTQSIVRQLVGIIKQNNLYDQIQHLSGYRDQMWEEEHLFDNPAHVAASLLAHPGNTRSSQQQQLAPPPGLSASNVQAQPNKLTWPKPGVWNVHASGMRKGDSYGEKGGAKGGHGFQNNNNFGFGSAKGQSKGKGPSLFANGALSHGLHGATGTGIPFDAYHSGSHSAPGARPQQWNHQQQSGFDGTNANGPHANPSASPRFQGMPSAEHQYHMPAGGYDQGSGDQNGHRTTAHLHARARQGLHPDMSPPNVSNYDPAPGVGQPLPHENPRDPVVLLRLQNELMTKTMTQCLTKMSASSQQGAASKAVPPKCNLSAYTKNIGELTTHLKAYKLAVWRYVAAATSSPEIGLELQAFTSEIFERLLAIEKPNWTQESPFWTPPEHLSKTPANVVSAICDNIREKGDVECVTAATEWIQQYAQGNLSAAALLISSTWSDLVAYMVKLDFKFNLAATQQTLLEAAVTNPTLTKSGIFKELAQWDSDLLALAQRDISAANTFIKSGAKNIHTKLLELFKDDRTRSTYIVNHALEYKINDRVTTYENYQQFVEHVKVLLAPDNHGSSGGNALTLGSSASAPATSIHGSPEGLPKSQIRCMYHVMGCCSSSNHCIHGYSHLRNAVWPNGPRRMLNRISREKSKPIPSHALRDCERVESVRINLTHVTEPHDAGTFNQDDFVGTAADDIAPYPENGELSQVPFVDASDTSSRPEGVRIHKCDIVYDNLVSPLAGCDNAQDPVINSEILTENGFITVCYTKQGQTENKKCATWCGIGYCQHELIYGYKTCKFEHPEAERASFLNIKCDPKRCKMRTGCPKNHTDKTRVKRLIDVAPDNAVTIKLLLMNSSITATWDYESILAGHDNSVPVHVKQLKTCALQDTALMSDSGANGGLMDFRDYRQCYLSGETIKLFSSQGVSEQLVGVCVVPFYPRTPDEAVHARSRPPSPQKWCRVRCVIVNVNASADEPFVGAILPSNWFGHFLDVRDTHSGFFRHPHDALQDEDGHGLGDLKPTDIAMFWRDRLPMVAGGEIISFDRSKVATPLPWEPGWTGPPEFAQSVNTQACDELQASLFRNGPL